MLALQLVIGVGIALIFPLLIYSGVATFRSPPKPSNRTNLVPETSEEAKQANREQIRREQEELTRARVAYAKLLFTVMAPAGFVAVLAGYAIGISAVGVGLLSGGILCMVYGYAGYWGAPAAGDAFRKHACGVSDAPVHWIEIFRPLTTLQFAHDLRANATRLSRGKTAPHFSGSCVRLVLQTQSIAMDVPVRA
jgi:hypothetical protein